MKRFCSGPPNAILDVRKVGVDVHGSIAGVVGRRNRRGHTLSYQGCDQLLGCRTQRFLVGSDHFGDRNGPQGRLRPLDSDPDAAAQPEPVVGRILEREWNLDGVCLRESEGPSDDRAAHLRHRHGSLAVDRETSPEQGVLP